MTITFQPLNDAGRLLLASDLDTPLDQLNRSIEGLKAEIDRLAIQLEHLVAERAHIVATLTAFYKSDITLSSLTPILDLATALNPSLKETGRG